MPGLVLSIDARDAARGAAQWDRATRQVSTDAGRVDRSVRAMDTGMGRAGATVGRLARSIGGLFGVFSGAIAVRAATNTMASFEETMAQVEGVTNATAENFERLNSTARQLGATTRFTASQVGDALLFLSRTGFSVNESIAAVPATLNLALAGMLDLGSAADYASNIVKAFNLRAEDTVRVVDALVSVSNRSNTNVTQLADALRFVGPIAAKLGLTVEETSAAIGGLGDSGIQATMAGTSLRQVLASLVSPSGQAAKTLEGLGINVKGLAQTIREGDIADLFTQIKNSGIDVGDVFTVFDNRAAASALVIQDSIGKIKELTKVAGGDAQRFADIMDKTLIGSFKSFASAAQELVLQVGDAGVLGALKGMIDRGTDVLRVFAGMTDNMRGSREEAEKLAAALKLVGVFAATFIGIKTAALAAALAIKAVTLALAANPFTLAAVAVAAVVTALYQYRDVLININGATATVGDFVVATWETVAGRMSAAFTLVRVTVEDLWTSFAGGATIVLNSVDNLVTSINDTLSGLFDKFANFGLSTLTGASKAELDALAVRDSEFVDPFREHSLGGLKPVGPLQSAERLARSAKEEVDKLFSDIGAAAELRRLKREIEQTGPPASLANQFVAPTIPGVVDTSPGVAGESAAEVAKLTEAMQRLETVATSVGDSFTNFFTDLITGAATAADAFRALAAEIAQVVVRTAIAEPIGKSISTGITAAGTALFGGFPAIPSFATGGVVTRPTLAMVGESGPEAIVPLGDRSEAGIRVVQNFNVSTPDANSFRRSRRQIARDFGSFIPG